MMLRFQSEKYHDNRYHLNKYKIYGQGNLYPGQRESQGTFSNVWWEPCLFCQPMIQQAVCSTQNVEPFTFIYSIIISYIMIPEKNPLQLCTCTWQDQTKPILQFLDCHSVDYRFKCRILFYEMSRKIWKMDDDVQHCGLHILTKALVLAII